MPRFARLAYLLLFAVGCSSEETTHPVSGRVHFRDGTPVPFGVIEFLPSNGRPPARAVLNKDGTFALKTGPRDGAVAGSHRIVIVQVASADGAASHIRRQHKFVRTVAAKYRNFETSGLEREIKAGANSFVFEVESSP